MHLYRRGRLGDAVSSALPLSGAWAQGAPIRIGVPSGRSDIYRGSSGPAAAEASRRDVVAALKRIPTDDDAFGLDRVREDGRKLTPSYLFDVKKPEDSNADWELDRLLATTPDEEAFRPLKDGHCSLVRA